MLLNLKMKMKMIDNWRLWIIEFISNLIVVGFFFLILLFWKWFDLVQFEFKNNMNILLPFGIILNLANIFKSIIYLFIFKRIDHGGHIIYFLWIYIIYSWNWECVSNLTIQFDSRFMIHKIRISILNSNLDLTTIHSIPHGPQAGTYSKEM